MMTEREARALLARPVPVAVAAGLLAVPPDLLAGLASGGHVTLADAWRAVRRALEARLAAARAARRGAYMRARRAVQRAARAAVRPERAQAALAALGAAVARELDAVALSLTGLDPRTADRLPRIAAAVAYSARHAFALRLRGKAKGRAAR